ncbi:MAG: S41 family peptidase [bacterium]
MNEFEKRYSRDSYVVLILLCLFFITVGFFTGSVFFPRIDKKTNSNIDSSGLIKFNQVADKLNSDFYYRDKLQTSLVEDSTIKGLLAGLGDPPTRYYNTQEYSQYKEALAGNIFGIGIEISSDNGSSKINAVYSGSPAEKAGVLKDDVIIKVDDKDTEGLTTSDVANLIRGPIGTKVTISFRRKEEVVVFPIIRDKIKTDSIKFSNLNNDGICKIDILRFTDESVIAWDNNWDVAVAKFNEQKCTKLIIDLRNNGGGYVDAAKYSLGEFVNDGTVIFGQKKSNGSIENVASNRDVMSKSSGVPGKLRDTKTVIIINSSSASASEIFAGAMQSLGRAKLVGINSYGKGSVQETYPFTDGSAMVFTTANWTLPNGQVIDKNYPITPDQVVTISEEDTKIKKDPQLDKAIELLK